MSNVPLTDVKNRKHSPGRGASQGVMILGSLVIAVYLFEIVSHEGFDYLWSRGNWFHQAIALLLLVLTFLLRKRIHSLETNLIATQKETDYNSKLLSARDSELLSSNEELKRINDEFNTTAQNLIRRDLDLTEANGHLTELDKSKTEFVAIAAHQLRTPLTGIRWTCESILNGAQGELSKDVREAIAGAYQSVLHLIGVANDLLTISKIEEGQFGYTLKSESLNDILDANISVYDLTIKDKKIRLEKNISPNIWINCDKEKLARAFDNLIDNAVKYSPEGGTIVITLLTNESGVVFSVADSGIGIRESDLPRIFDKFFRGANAVHSVTIGSGLGLYMVKTIVARHGGEVKVKSKEDEGSIFTITLPSSLIPSPHARLHLIPKRPGCSSLPATMKGIVSSLPGVISVDVEYESRALQIEFDPKKLSKEVIIAKIGSELGLFMIEGDKTGSEEPTCAS